jgi:hypothetical protein
MQAHMVELFSIISAFFNKDINDTML